MENQDKLYEQFKDAVSKAEKKDFVRMEAVWNRVEEKLDTNKQRKIATWWKYTAMAAVFLLFMGVGIFMLNNENNTVITPKTTPENSVTVIDTQKVKETFDPAKAVEKEAIATTEKTTKKVPVYKAVVSSGAETSAGDGVAIAEPEQNDTALSKDYAASPTGDMSGAAPQVAKEKGQPAGADKKFSGIITDSQGMPLPGAVVFVEGNKNGTQADIDGKYMIDAKEGEKLVASFVGMETQSVTLGKQKDNVNLKLADDSVALQEVTVEAYRTTARATSNATSKAVTSKKAEDKPKLNMEQTLQAGADGQPGPASTVAVRGIGSVNDTNEPLIIVDDVSVSGEYLQNIETKNIESIMVLKDADAISLYGERGRNGVVIIKTKDGLTKKEKRKLERERKKQQRATAKQVPFNKSPE